MSRSGGTLPDSGSAPEIAPDTTNGPRRLALGIGLTCLTPPTSMLRRFSIIRLPRDVLFGVIRFAQGCGNWRGVFDLGPAGHPGPVVVGTAQFETAGPFRHEVEILRLTRLHHDLGPVGVERLRVAHRNCLEKVWRRELVRFLSSVLDVEAIGDAAPEGELLWVKLVLTGDDGNRPLLRCIGGSQWSGCNDRRQQGDRPPDPPTALSTIAHLARMKPDYRRSVFPVSGPVGREAFKLRAL